MGGDVDERRISFDTVWLAELPPPVERENFFAPQAVCPFCSADSRKAIPRFAVQQLFWKLNVIECQACKLCYKEAFPTAKFLLSIYGRDYPHFEAGNAGSDSSVFKSRVRRMGCPKGRHLDYGCGVGSFVGAAMHFGWDSYGADPYLPEKTVPGVPKERLFLFNAATLDADVVRRIGRFDCISMWAVLEHLPAPDATIRGILTMLNPGGILIFNAPNPGSMVARRDGGRWQLAILLEHLLFWSPDTVVQMAARHGMKVLRISVCGSPYPFGRDASSQSSQGLRGLPFQCLNIESLDHKVGSPSKVVTMAGDNVFRQRVHQTLRQLMVGPSSSWRETILRQFISIVGIGDHIEAVLQKI